MATLDLVVNVLTRNGRDLDNLAGKLDQAGKRATIGLTLPLLAAGGAVTKLAADAEQADARVAAAFKSMDADSFTSLDHLQQKAEELMSETTFDDEAIKEAQAVLLTFGKVGEKAFDPALEAALNISTALGTDLQSAVIQVGKALNDPIAGLTGLTRAGIQFTDQQKEQIRAMVEAGDIAGAQGIILAELERQFGGMAQAMADTASGQMTQAFNQLGEAGEGLGIILLPLFAQLAGIIKTIAAAFTGLDPGMQQFIVTAGAIVIAVGPVLIIASKLIGAFGAIGSAFKVLSSVLAANPYIALIAGTVAIATLIIANWDEIVASVKAALSGLMRFFSSVIDTVATIGGKIWQPIGTGFSAAIDFIKGIWNAFARWWNSIQISVPSIDVPFVGRVGGFNVGLPDLPYLAEGGIINHPTLAVLGEAGPEAVIPLRNGGLGMGELHIHLTNVGEPIEEEDDILETLKLLVPHIRDAVPNG